MFFSAHDLAAMLIVAAAAGTVALGVTDPDGAEPPPLSASRACVVVAASAVAPGSGHVLLGHRRAGGALLGIYLLAVASAAMVGVLAGRSWETLVAHAVHPGYLSALNGVALAVAAVWALAVLHAGWLVLRRAASTPSTPGGSDTPSCSRERRTRVQRL